MKIILAQILILVLLSIPPQVFASEVLGIHILNPDELESALDLFDADSNTSDWNYVTVPLTLDDIHKKEMWQRFFDLSREKKIRPIVRLATKFEGASWKIPTRKDIVDLSNFLSTLEWPDGDRIVIVFNEPNHAGEWGGTIDPESYSRIFTFTADWLHSEQKNYTVLPAAMDLAAPNGINTLEAFNYLSRVINTDSRVVELLDGWASHSYPNPAFSSSPTQTGKNSIRGFVHELDFLAKYTDRKIEVYITETGWMDSRATSRFLYTYYKYAVDHVWSDPRVKAVTPFVLRGAPGAFAGFSFLDENGKPTRQYEAYKKAIDTLGEKK